MNLIKKPDLNSLFCQRYTLYRTWANPQGLMESQMIKIIKRQALTKELTMG
jgi:hypothetical protein